MSRVRLPKLIIPGTVGAIAGVLLIPYAYFVQGGEPLDFALVGAVTGAAIAVAYAHEFVRLSLVGAAFGSIAGVQYICRRSHQSKNDDQTKKDL